VIKLDDSNFEADKSNPNRRRHYDYRHVVLFKFLKLAFKKNGRGAYIAWTAHFGGKQITHYGEFRKGAVVRTLEKFLNYHPSEICQALIQLAFEKTYTEIY
jgi:hypothetical protein